MSTGAPTEQGVSIRFPSTALLCVDSADAEQYDANGFRIGLSNPSDLNVNRQRPLLFGYMTRVSLTEVNMQWNIGNVNASNNTLGVVLYNNGVAQESVLVQVDNGFYTLPSLCAALASRLNLFATGGALTLQWQISLGEGTNVYPCSAPWDPSNASSTRSALPYVRIELVGTSSANAAFEIVPYNWVSDIPGIALPSRYDDLTNMLGITPTRASGNRYYRRLFGGYASAQYTPYVDIESNILTKNQNVQDGSSQKAASGQKLARLYMSDESMAPREITLTYDISGVLRGSTDNAIGTAPLVFRREFQVPKQIQWNTTENVDVIDLKVIDYRGQTLPLGPYAGNTTTVGNLRIINNTSDFQFTVQATEV